MNIPYFERRLAQSRVMLAAADNGPARISHAGLVCRYEELLGRRIAESETLEQEVGRLRADGEKISDFTSKDYAIARPAAAN